ncbi:myo-inositol 2-dehydrogenase, partial [Klebsiella pneumoniae]
WTIPAAPATGTMNGSPCWAPKARWSPVASRRRALPCGAAISALSRACGRTGSAGYRDLITSILTPLFAP